MIQQISTPPEMIAATNQWGQIPVRLLSSYMFHNAGELLWINRGSAKILINRGIARFEPVQPVERAVNVQPQRAERRAR